MARLVLTHIILHHTAAEEKDTEQIRRYHMSKGWQDIGYDYVIEKDGKVVEGRSLSIQGAHAGVTYYNQHAIGVAVIGNLSNRDIYPAQLSALVDLVYNLMKKWNISLENILLHREIKATECPGVRFPKEKIMSLLRKKITDEHGTDPDLLKKIEELTKELTDQKEQNTRLKLDVARMQKALEEIKLIVINT